MRSVLPPTKEAIAGAAAEAGAAASDSMDEDAPSGPRWFPAATAADVAAAPMPAGRSRWAPPHPQLESISRRLVTWLEDATGVGALSNAGRSSRAHRSAKIARVLEDVRGAIAEDGGRGKVVIFSQFKAAVLHMRTVLAEEGIGNVSIVRGDSRESTGHAIAAFNGDGATHVFVLHASACAAGLTLTAARHVFLLEPFLRAGEEAQARNRVHRIGQTRDVVARTYFTRCTIEERILAWRARTTARAAAATGGSSAATGEAGAAGDDADADAPLGGVLSAGDQGVGVLSPAFLRFVTGTSEEAEPAADDEEI